MIYWLTRTSRLLSPMWDTTVFTSLPTMGFLWWLFLCSQNITVKPGKRDILVDHKSTHAQAKAMHISSLLRDRRRTSLQEICDWIEYVLRHGGARHLRPQMFNIPWYQYYLLDVMAFLVAVVTLVVMVIRMTSRCLSRLCCKRSGSKPKKE